MSSATSSKSAARSPSAQASYASDSTCNAYIRIIPQAPLLSSLLFWGRPFPGPSVPKLSIRNVPRGAYRRALIYLARSHVQDLSPGARREAEIRPRTPACHGAPPSASARSSASPPPASAAGAIPLRGPAIDCAAPLPLPARRDLATPTISASCRRRAFSTTRGPGPALGLACTRTCSECSEGEGQPLAAPARTRTCSECHPGIRASEYPGPRSRTHPPAPRPSLAPPPAAIHLTSRVSATRAARSAATTRWLNLRIPGTIAAASAASRAPKTHAHDHPTRRLQLRPAQPHHRRRAVAHLHVPLPRVPAPHRRRDQQPGALPPRADRLRRPGHRVDAHGRKRQRAHLPLLPGVRLHRLLGGRRLPRPRRRRHRHLRRPDLPRADGAGVGGVPATPGSPSRPTRRPSAWPKQG